MLFCPAWASWICTIEHGGHSRVTWSWRPTQLEGMDPEWVIRTNHAHKRSELRPLLVASRYESRPRSLSCNTSTGNRCLNEDVTPSWRTQGVNHPSVQILEEEEPDYLGDNFPDGSDGRRQNRTEPMCPDGQSKTQTTWSDRQDLKGTVQLKMKSHSSSTHPPEDGDFGSTVVDTEQLPANQSSSSQVRSEKVGVCWNRCTLRQQRAYRGRETLKIDDLSKYAPIYVRWKVYVMRSNVKAVIQKVIIERRS